jgi:nicotinate-nucleotide pyrophosphorylase
MDTVIIFLRGGYKFNHDTEGLSLGLGFSLKISGLMTNVNYSFNDAGNFSPINRISVGAITHSAKSFDTSLVLN